MGDFIRWTGHSAWLLNASAAPSVQNGLTCCLGKCLPAIALCAGGKVVHRSMYMLLYPVPLSPRHSMHVSAYGPSKAVTLLSGNFVVNAPTSAWIITSQRPSGSHSDFSTRFQTWFSNVRTRHRRSSRRARPHG